MDNNDNDNDNDIRQPDQVRKERLIGGGYDYEEPDNLDAILEISKREYLEKEQKYMERQDPIPSDNLNTILEISKHEYLEKEQKDMDLICGQLKDELCKERQNKFNTLKLQLNKMITIDKPNLHYYELVLSIIEIYESGLINEYDVSLTDYTNIFKLLKTIRLPIDEFENLKKIIILY